MKHLFLSDAHIGAFDDDTNLKIEQNLCKVAEWCLQHNVQLHILGDLLDYWMEYEKHVPELGTKALSCLRSYNENAPQPATFITGNHDNWTRGHFAELGFNVHQNYAEIENGQVSVFMHHGDGLSDSALRLNRPLLHKILRNKTFVSFYQNILPPAAGLSVMKKFSAYTRKRELMKTETLDKWSEWFLKNHDYDAVICGHDHVPRILNFAFGTYINVGTFFKDQTACLYTSNGFELVKWNNRKMDFTTYDKKQSQLSD